jgi:hypothetical protein
MTRRVMWKSSTTALPSSEASGAETPRRPPRPTLRRSTAHPLGSPSKGASIVQMKERVPGGVSRPGSQRTEWIDFLGGEGRASAQPFLPGLPLLGRALPSLASPSAGSSSTSGFASASVASAGASTTAAGGSATGGLSDRGLSDRGRNHRGRSHRARGLGGRSTRLAQGFDHARHSGGRWPAGRPPTFRCRPPGKARSG